MLLKVNLVDDLVLFDKIRVHHRSIWWYGGEQLGNETWISSLARLTRNGTPCNDSLRIICSN